MERGKIISKTLDVYVKGNHLRLVSSSMGLKCANFCEELMKNLTTQQTDREKTYSITELCREFEVTPRTLRFYEQKGLLAPARRGWTRIFKVEGGQRSVVTAATHG